MRECPVCQRRAPRSAFTLSVSRCGRYRMRLFVRHSDRDNCAEFIDLVAI